MEAAVKREVDMRDLCLGVGFHCSFSPVSLIVQEVSCSVYQNFASKNLADESCLHEVCMEPSTLLPSLCGETFLGTEFRI